MYKIFIQSNDNYTLNLISNENVLNKISYIIYNSYNVADNVTDKEYIQNLFNLKLKNRNIKTILQINVSETLNIFDYIKYTCEYGFDGILFTLNNNESIYKCDQIIKTLNLLPEPYNLNWEFYYLHINKNINIDLESMFYKNLNGIINFNLEQNFTKNIKIYDAKKNNVINSDFLFSDINMNIIYLLQHLDINNENNENNIHYPTSKFIKQIKQKNSLKRNAIYEIKFDLDLIK